ncbi:MAG: ribosome assembly cofactor RimP [Lutibacter sp.]|nr:ribosome assembly cofactor RimP [Lutibacter sp.]MBP9600667.1 ribosome assembly cofactor RimP [Lutibacter sp.]
MDKEKIKFLVNTALEENNELFLVDIQFLPENKIYVEIDGDSGVSLNECIRVSRSIEDNLDREEEDFSLEVATPDVAQPIKLTRQYIKNVGRTLSIKLKENKSLEGVLKNVTDQNIQLEWKTREPKPVGKGKVTVIKNESISFNDIVEAKVKIIF